MSNSSRIEAATRQHVGATLTSTQIAELVKLSDPTSSKGVYPSDCAYRRDESGKLIPRGKTAYGAGVLEYLGRKQLQGVADSGNRSAEASSNEERRSAITCPYSGSGYGQAEVSQGGQQNTRCSQEQGESQGSSPVAVSKPLPIPKGGHFYCIRPRFNLLR